MHALVRQLRLFAWLIGVLLLIACRGRAVALPTAIPTAGVPTLTATPAPLPPTRDIESSPTLPPTAVPPTALPSPTPTPVVAPVLSLTTPADGERAFVGEELVVGGYVHSIPGASVQVGLSSITGLLLATSQTEVEENVWQTSLEVPSSISGEATLEAVVVDEGGTVLARDTSSVLLAVNTESAERFMDLNRPRPGAVVVAGHNLFFDGRVQRPVGGRLLLSLFLEDCQTEVAQYGFDLRGSTYWQGYVILPRNISGEGCAVASVGEPGSENYVAAQVPVTVLSQNEPGAVGVLIANPVPGRRLLGGQTIEVNGLAYNAPGRQINFTASLTNGRLIADTVAETGLYGYWELELLLPVDIDGQIRLTVVLGEPDEPVAQAEHVYEIVPGPTPEP